MPFKGLCFDPSVIQPVGCDYKPKARLHELVVSGTVNIKDLEWFLQQIALTTTSRFNFRENLRFLAFPRAIL